VRGVGSVAYAAEAHGSPAQRAAGLVTGVRANSTGGNLEGKEQRFGIAGSAIFEPLVIIRTWSPRDLAYRVTSVTIGESDGSPPVRMMPK